jgi:peptidoglycan/xylan/chitin deacetylase (PgdA/CDA1 family)
MPALGPRTDDLAFYLFLQGIPATFFVIGEHAVNEPELCEQLERWGHLVVNHTQTHYGLTWELNDLGTTAVIDDVVTGGVSIGAAANSDSLLLRPPYVEWNTDVADCLNSDANSRRFTGPIMFDIGPNDWQFWQATNQTAANTPAQQLASCLSAYRNAIAAVRHGLLLMHDCSQDPAAAALNQTFELTRQLIPQLLTDGYRFIRLDAVPQVRSAMLVSSIVGLKAASGFYVSPLQGGGASIPVNGQGLYQWEELGLVQLGNSQVAIRTSTGQFLSTQPTGEILANGNGVYDWERFDLLNQGGPLVALRAWTGNYATVPTAGPHAGHLVATSAGITQDERFTLEYLA